jgi:hypothetical protein
MRRCVPVPFAGGIAFATIDDRPKRCQGVPGCRRPADRIDYCPEHAKVGAANRVRA